MGFEDGEPSSIAESTNPDTEAPKVQDSFSLEEKIKTACGQNFYGTLFFVYDKGRLTHFYFNRTWQGRSLENMLKGETAQQNAGIPKRARIMVAVGR